VLTLPLALPASYDEDREMGKRILFLRGEHFELL
jgi:hypothetical protein